MECRSREVSLEFGMPVGATFRVTGHVYEV